MEWNKKVEKLLLGRKIIKIEWMANKEAEDCGWYSRPVCLLLDSGVWIYPMRDDEGNDGGALATSSESMPVIPVFQLEEAQDA
jgi:hypothetical protein